MNHRFIAKRSANSWRECGISDLNPVVDIAHREIKVENWAWMAALYCNLNYRCGGTISKI